MIDAAWAAIIVTVVLALIAAFVGMWKHVSEQINLLHARITGLRTDMETRFTNVDAASRHERHALVDRFDGKVSEVSNEARDQRDRIIMLERNGGQKHA